MHVFVTGATGFVGFHTVVALLQAGHSVRLGVRNAEKMQALYAKHGIAITDFAVGEITDKVSVERALDDCDGVVHTAAIVSLDANMAEQMHTTNVVGTQLVIGGAVARGMESIVYVSSAAALFNPALDKIDESCPLTAATSAYAKSKIDAEKYVQGLIDEGARVAITYPTGVVGPDDPSMSEGNQSLSIIFKYTHMNTAGGMQVIDVRELASAHVGLLEGKKSGRYLVAGHYIPWSQMGEMLDAITGLTLRKVNVPVWLLRALGSSVDLIGRVKSIDVPLTREAVTYATEWVLCDDSKIRNQLGLEYRPLRETFKDTILWMAQAGQIDRKWVARIKADGPV